MQKIILTLASIMLIAFSTLSAQANKTYCNSRFGFCIGYPAELGVSTDSPVNGDGIVLETPNGIEVSVSGSFNVMNWAPGKILEYTTEDFTAIIGAKAEAMEAETTAQGFEALLAAGTYYQYAQMRSKGNVYVVLTVTGPERLLEDMKSLREQLKLTFGNTAEGR